MWGMRVGSFNHHNDFNIRAHIFLCIIGMIFYRYLAWKCKHLRLSLRRLAEELGRMRVSSKEELIDRTGRYFDGINETPVIFKWKYKMDEMSGGIDV